MTELKQIVANPENLSAGSWVFNQQGVAADEGFRNVSQYWLPKTLTFEQGLEKLEAERAEREDITAKPLYLKPSNTEKQLEIGIEGEYYRVTDHAARQLCTWLGVPQTMWTHYSGGDWGDREVIRFALENGLQHWAADKADKELLFRTYKDGTLRAVLSTGYSIVDNRWYLETLQEFIPGGRLSHFAFSNADTLFGAILMPDTLRMESDSEYGGLLDISNCEIGRRVIAQTPSLFRAICMNGCRWGETAGTELRKRHRGLDLNTLKTWIRDNIHKQIPLLTTHIDTLLGTRMLKATTTMDRIFGTIAKANQFSSDVTNQIAREWFDHSNEHTAFGVIDAITRAGQKFDGDVWSQCNGIGGELVMMGTKGWDSLNARAKAMEDKDIKKVFAL